MYHIRLRKKTQNKILLKSSCTHQFPASFNCWTLPWSLIKKWTIAWQDHIKVASSRNNNLTHSCKRATSRFLKSVHTRAQDETTHTKMRNSAGMAKPQSQPSWSWTHTIIVPEISATALIAKWCQLKKELFFVLSSSSVSSNWSAPKDATQGFCPPYPIATIYRPKKNMMCWDETEYVQAGQTCGSVEMEMLLTGPTSSFPK